MARQKGSGSIILEILIVLCFVLLIFTLYIPKKLWDEEEAETQECRSRMNAIWKVEQEYLRANNVYTDTLQYAIEMVTSDTSYIGVLDTLLYHNDPDSLYTCPSTGLSYILKFTNEEKTGLKVECPNEYREVKYYLFFTKKIDTHGSITDGEKSWTQ